MQASVPVISLVESSPASVLVVLMDRSPGPGEERDPMLSECCRMLSSRAEAVRSCGDRHGVRDGVRNGDGDGVRGGGGHH